MSKRVLVYGFGNPGRQDDGLGPLMAEIIEELHLSNVDTDSNYQLNIEDADNINDYDFVVFVDASKGDIEPYEYKQLKPAKEISFSTHAMSPESVLALHEDLYDKKIDCNLLAIKGYEWEFGVAMTKEAEANLQNALVFLKDKIAEFLN